MSSTAFISLVSSLMLRLVMCCFCIITSVQKTVSMQTFEVYFFPVIIQPNIELQEANVESEFFYFVPINLATKGSCEPGKIICTVPGGGVPYILGVQWKFPTDR